MKKLLFLIPIILIASCNPCKRLQRICPPVVKDSVVYTETIAENPYYTIPDSAFWSMVFRCDSNYNVVLQDYEELSSGINSQVTIREVPVKDVKVEKYLKVLITASTDSIKTLNKTIEKLRNEKSTTTITKEIPVPVKYVPKFYKWLLVIFIFEIVLLAGYAYLKIRGFKIPFLK